MTEDVLVADGLRKRLALSGAKEFALESISLRLRRREMTALMGHSGCGKTTLIQLLGLLMRPDSGRLTILGTDVGSLSRSDAADFRRRRIGFVFQAFNLLPQHSALRNVMLAARTPHRRSRPSAEALLARVGLDVRRHHRPGELSAGEQQRVAFARALINEPDLLLADEPTGNLDEANEGRLLELFRNYAHEGHAVVIVTHGDRVAAAADRTLTMSAGRLADGRAG